MRKIHIYIYIFKLRLKSEGIMFWLKINRKIIKVDLKILNNKIYYIIKHNK